MLNDAGEAGDVQRRLTTVSCLAGRPSGDLEAHCGRATGANWLIDVIDGASSYLAVGISMEHIRP